MTHGFETVDYIVLLCYLAGIAFLGIRLGGRHTSASDYFLGRDKIPWWLVCFAIVAAETSALTFISIPGLAYLSDLTFLQVTFGYLLGRVVVSYVLLPTYFRGELTTAYAFLGSRFGRNTRGFASVVFLLTRIAADGVRLFATAIPLKFVLDVEYPVAIVLLALVALLYTGIGGLRGVIWVDAIQMFVYLGGAMAAAIVLVAGADGGWESITRAAAEAGKFRVFDVAGRESGFWQSAYTLPAGLLGGALLSMASHGTDQLIVQRVLATRSVESGRRALIGSGVIIVLQFSLFLLVGLLLYGHYGGRSVAQLGLRRSDEIFPMFIVEGLPPGLSGFIIAGLLAAALSTLAGSMSSMASSTVLDLYRSFRSARAEPARELKLSRVVTVVWAALLVVSALFFMNTSQTVVELALGIASFTYGGLLGTFLLGVMFRTPREPHALVAFAGGVLAMILVITLGLVAWTWYTPVGVVVTIAIGLLVQRLLRGGEGGAI